MNNNPESGEDQVSKVTAESNAKSDGRQNFLFIGAAKQRLFYISSLRCAILKVSDETKMKD